MTSLSVVLPSWSPKRVEDLIQQLTRAAGDTTSDVQYIVVGCPPPDAVPVLSSTLWIESQYPLSPVEAMSVGSREAIGDVIAFLHDDVEMYERGWDQVILDHFANHPRCGLVGFGGGIGFADIDIYKVPYDYRQLARVDFVSNMREAESHGRRVTEPVRVAALDGFALITSREFYMQAGDRLIWQNPPLTDPPSVGAPKLIGSNGAWEVCLKDGVPYHMYDAWLSCRAAELGYEVWMLPVACHHQGGQTSVSRQTEYTQVVERLGYGSAEELYAKGHEAIYKRFAGVLPIRVGSTS